MAIVSLFSASHCHGPEVAQAVREKLGYGLLSTEQLLAATSERFSVSEDKLNRAMHGPVSVFNRLTHEKEHNLAFLRAALAELVQQDNLVYHGFAGHLLPKYLPNVLRVCLVARTDYRASQAVLVEGIEAAAAEKMILKDDEERKAWTLHLFGLSPWAKGLYDILLPMDSTSVDEAAAIVCENARKPPVETTPAAQAAMGNFLLASQVQVALAQNGHDIDLDVSAEDGLITITINRYVLRLENLKNELREVALKVPGTREMQTKLGPHFHPPNRFEEMVEDHKPKYLLVDDEKEFVLTLSERLETRNLGSAIAYDGEEALSIVETDAPDVMVLDLKMPGIDGMEVLRRVKHESPGTEVIILTGHGSEQEERQAAELGAFAYLEKPVNIDVLTETMKKAYSRAKSGEAETS
jgi:two-component system, OmpR family, response regulator CpxR